MIWRELENPHNFLRKFNLIHNIYKTNRRMLSKFATLVMFLIARTEYEKIDEL